MGAITKPFLNRPANIVAKELIGCVIVRKTSKGTMRLLITETEAYDGFKDKASHASRGQTPRNKIMFDSAGHIYVYLTYGIHWMLNIVTGQKGYPSAVLIRGGLLGDGKKVVNGPAKVTKTLGINGTMNGKTLSRKNGLWIERKTANSPNLRIKTAPRIGVDYAGPFWSKKKWRFLAY